MIAVTPASRTVSSVLADGPPGNVQIFIWMDVGPTCHSFVPSHFVQSRAELERSRRRRPLPSISLFRPPNLDSSRENLPRHLLHPPKPPVRLLPGRNRPTTAGHHGRRLKPCSTVDPFLRSSSDRTDRGNGFVVSSSCSPAFFLFRGVSPAPVNDRRRRRRTCCHLWRGSKVRHRGRSAVESRICPETLPSLVDWISEPRTVRQGGLDSPQVGLESVPETLLSLVG